ncbi:MAG: hypothetical protein WDO69_09360 [Pseudomonadota bacterium]
MLLVDDDDELPELPDERETDLAARLGSGGLATIDATLLACTEKVQHKIARIISHALDVGGFPPEDDYIAVHARRLIGLANAGAVVIFGNPRRPRWSEARRSYEPIADTSRGRFANDSAGINPRGATRPRSPRF